MALLKRIDHTTLYPADPEALAAHIDAVFECPSTPLEDDPNVLLMEQGTVHFFIVKRPSSELPADQHLSFEVTDLRALKQRLDQIGLGYRTGRFSGFKSRNYDWCEWRAPDNIRLEGVEIISSD